MTWLDDMNRDAVAICFPDWEMREDDVVTIRPEYKPDQRWSDYTFESSSFTITIKVVNPTTHRQNVVHLTDEEAEEFWKTLMEKGTQ